MFQNGQTHFKNLAANAIKVLLTFQIFDFLFSSDYDFNLPTLSINFI